MQMWPDTQMVLQRVLGTRTVYLPHHQMPLVLLLLPVLVLVLVMIWMAPCHRLCCPALKRQKLLRLLQPLKALPPPTLTGGRMALVTAVAAPVAKHARPTGTDMARGIIVDMPGAPLTETRLRATMMSEPTDQTARTGVIEREILIALVWSLWIRLPQTRRSQCTWMALLAKLFQVLMLVARMQCWTGRCHRHVCLLSGLVQRVGTAPLVVVMLVYRTSGDERTLRRAR